jgi:SAM-dependent methyltransferase
MLRHHLPSTSRYVGLDVSPRMVALAQNRLQGWPDRVKVTRIDGRTPWPVPDDAADRVVATYLLDLLDPVAVKRFFAEAERVLRPRGLVATVSLAPGPGPLSRMISAAWSGLWQVNPHLTGGCRPLNPVAVLPDGWHTQSNTIVSSWAIASSVLIARPLVT